MSLGDRIVFVFKVFKGDLEGIIGRYEYEVITLGLRGVSENCAHEQIELTSWTPVEKPFAINYNPFSFDSITQAKNSLAAKLTAEAGFKS